MLFVFNSEYAPPFPGPTDGQTSFGFYLTQPALVNMTILDGWGKEVAFPVAEPCFSPDNHEIEEDLSRLWPGIYSCRIRANGQETRKGFKIVKK